jgi:hypothetical protein
MKIDLSREGKIMFKRGAEWFSVLTCDRVIKKNLKLDSLDYIFHFNSAFECNKDSFF